MLLKWCNAMNKYFLISIDTEGDNQWEWKNGDIIETKNALYLPRFQSLCEKYRYKPTYLSNYEMATSKPFQEFAKPCVKNGTAEIGMHLHAWSTPPEFQLPRFQNPNNAPYLIEYPDDIMEKKISVMTDVLKDVFQCEITTHRSGRWALDERYIRLLQKYGYAFDCSVTPGVSWKTNPGQSEGSVGSDYTNEKGKPYIIGKGDHPLLEIPMTIIPSHHAFKPTRKDLKAAIGTLYRAAKGQMIWLRPSGNNLEQMKWIVESIRKSNCVSYVMFMIHSSEFMAGGSPYYKTEASIDKLFSDIEELFKFACMDFQGATIGEYGKLLMKDMV